MKSMDTEQLQQLRTLVENAGDLPEEAKGKLLQLMDQAGQSVSSEETTPADAAGSLLSSVQELEASHPEATSFLNRIATILANMGI